MSWRVLWYATAAAALAVAPAPAIVSVVSSFEVARTGSSFPWGVYRDDRYVYEIVNSKESRTLRRYSTSGRLLRTRRLAGARVLRDAGPSHLGAGYFSVVEVGTGRLLSYTTAGSFVSAQTVPRNARGFDRFPHKREYFLSSGRYVDRYDFAGRRLSRFDARALVNDLATARTLLGRGGEYVIVGYEIRDEPTRIFTSDGSLVMFFTMAGYYNWGAVSGPADPQRFGITYWCNRRVGNDVYAYQVDINGTAPAVSPASLGKVKALFK